MCEFIKKSIIKLILCIPSGIILLIPNLLIKLKHVKTAYVLLITNMIIPMILASYLLYGGFYDNMLFRIYNRFNIL